MFESWIMLSSRQIAIQWISVGKTNQVIHWIVIYPLDSIIHLSSITTFPGKWIIKLSVTLKLEGVNHPFWHRSVTQICYILHRPAQSPRTSHTSHRCVTDCIVLHSHLTWVPLVTCDHMSHVTLKLEGVNHPFWHRSVTQICYILHCPVQSPHTSHTSHRCVTYCIILHSHLMRVPGVTQMCHRCVLTVLTQIHYILHCPAQVPHVNHSSHTDVSHNALSCTVTLQESL